MIPETVPLPTTLLTPRCSRLLAPWPMKRTWLWNIHQSCIVFQVPPSPVTMGVELVEGILPKMGKQFRLRIYKKWPRINEANEEVHNPAKFEGGKPRVQEWAKAKLSDSVDVISMVYTMLYPMKHQGRWRHRVCWYEISCSQLGISAPYCGGTSQKTSFQALSLFLWWFGRIFHGGLNKNVFLCWPPKGIGIWKTVVSE